MTDLSKLTEKELEELFTLKEKIFGENKFVVMDFQDPEQFRYNELMLKMVGAIR